LNGEWSYLHQTSASSIIPEGPNKETYVKQRSIQPLISERDIGEEGKSGVELMCGQTSELIGLN